MPPHIIRQIEAETSKLGVGLAGMRERIHELGGRFVVSSNNRGTCVQASIPLGIDHPTPMRIDTEHIV
jgi:signal transduction histidine kinase